MHCYWKMFWDCLMPHKSSVLRMWGFNMNNDNGKKVFRAVRLPSISGFLKLDTNEFSVRLRCGQYKSKYVSHDDSSRKSCNPSLVLEIVRHSTKFLESTGSPTVSDRHVPLALHSIMPVLLSNKIARQEPSVAAQPLALIKKKTLMPSLTSMTKIFLAKAFPSPRMKLWGTQSSPTGVDDPMVTSTDKVSSEDARGDICEIVVVAIQKIIDSSANEHDRVSTMGPGRLQKASIWGSTKWPQGQLQLPHHIICSVRSGATTKVSAQPERNDREFVFDEKFIFERREKDELYHEVTIEVTSVAPGFSKKHCLGQVEVDLDAAFTAQTTGPIYRQSTLQTDDGSESGMEIYYVLHRLVVKNATAAAASRKLIRSSRSLNDEDDMDACGQIFPDLWYLC